MGIDFSGIKPDTELNQEWQPQEDIYSYIEKSAPWVVATAVFIATGCMVYILELHWKSSPFFHILGFLGKIGLAIVQFLLGLIKLILTGKASLIKAIPLVFRANETAITLPCLILAIPMTRIAYRIVSRIRIQRKFLPYVIGGSFLLASALLLTPSSVEQQAWIVYSLGIAVSWFVL